MHALNLLQNQGAANYSWMNTLVLFGGIVAIMYFLVIRPSRRQEQKRKEMLSQIRKNDKVLTSGGILGVVMSVKENEIVLKIDEALNVKVRVARSAITNVLNQDDDT